MSDVEIYTDGACRGNPGPGGWGVVLFARGQQKELRGGVAETTNNRMELTAAIQGLATLKRSCNVTVYTDSQYLRRGISEWLASWKKNDWRTKGKRPVKNADLWQELATLAAKHNVEWLWVKAHSGNPGNELADQLANIGVEENL